MNKKPFTDAETLPPPWNQVDVLIAMEGNPELLVKVTRLLLKQLDADLPLIRCYVQADVTLALKDRFYEDLFVKPFS